MTGIATVSHGLEVFDGTGILLNKPVVRTRFGVGAGRIGKQETISLTGGAFTALTVPTGSKLLVLLLGAAPTAVSLVLKGVTGDTGIAIAPASNPTGADLQIPLGATPSIGILNNSSTVTVEAIWL